jgi:hypothetical protein
MPLSLKNLYCISLAAVPYHESGWLQLSLTPLKEANVWDLIEQIKGWSDIEKGMIDVP